MTGPHVFQGDDRFSITRELGHGGMGIVYEASDRERGETIALKTLHWADPAAIYRLKKEFRALADVAHPNLVNYYELIAKDDTWFFTMELVDGRHFLDYVRPGGEALDVERLRAALRQLVEGVAALHSAGRVHRDLKPPNVLVTDAGRVVILDFGIVAELVATLPARTVEDAMAGTIEYMSPEQCAGTAASAASDWYAVGVLLYEALTGELPFTGSMLYVLTQKQASDPRRPDDVVPGLPADLVEICVSLLARTPSDRLSETELLRRLGVSEPTVLIDAHVRGPEEVHLVGRDVELGMLQEVFAAAARGRAVALSVHGPSGIGKTTLIRHFTAGLVAAGQAIVLAGRCYVRESVPYKALDGVIDTLSLLLKHLPDEVVESQLPPDTAALTRVFPVLRRVEAIDRRAGATREDIADQRVLRRRAFAALRELLAAISGERPVVIHIDDLQWADRDSVDLLDDLLASSAELRLVFILSFRSEDVPNVPFLQRLLDTAGTAHRKALEIGPLGSEAAADYARTVLGAEWPDAEAYAETLARETDGNPFLLDQIVRYVLHSGPGRDSASFDLSSVLRARIRQMPAGARDLVEVLAIAGQPIDADVAYRAAGLTGDERPLVSSLGIAHLLRASAGGTRIDLYHDRIRENFMTRLSSPATRTIHRRLAEGLEAKGTGDPESLYSHYLGAGEISRAASFAARAAEAAQTALAFERAASFYQRALDLREEPGPETQSWYVGLADALACAGSGGEAATAYLRATATADAATALDLERRAGQQLLISGRLDEGFEVIGRVLGKVGLGLARSPRGALAALIARRIRLRIRGRRYRERPAAEIPAAALTRIDTCWAVAEGMALVDNIQGAAFQTLHLLLALEAGEPSRVARALAMEAGFVASSGSATEAAALLAEAEELARRLGSQSVLGLCKMIGAVLAFHLGRCERAEQLAQESEALLATEHSFAAWPLTIARVYHIPILIELGRVAELCRLTEEWLADAMGRGNRFAATMFRTGWGCFVWLREDDVDGARKALADALPRRREGAYYLSDFYGLMYDVLTNLYAGDGEAAYRHVSEAWPLLRRSQLLRIKRIRVRYLQFRAASAVAAAGVRRDRDRLLRAAERDARWVERQRHTQGRINMANGRLLRAAVEATRGHHETALGHLADAMRVYDETRSQLYLAAAKRRMGEMVQGDEGRALIAEADAWMAGEGIVNPRRFTRALAPGFPDRAADLSA